MNNQKAPNIDTKTGIHYGVIPVNRISQLFWYISEPKYGNFCPYCGNEPKSGNDIHNMLRCPTCYHNIDSDFNFQEEEPEYFELNDGTYRATQSHDDTDIFILCSPYYTKCDFCSPCAPGAGYIIDSNENGVKSYCFGHDCFDSGNAPYKVFDVKTDKEILPENK